MKGVLHSISADLDAGATQLATDDLARLERLLDSHRRFAEFLADQDPSGTTPEQ